MGASSSISIEWLNWILENLARGCSPSSLVSVMAERDYDKTVADQLVSKLANFMNANAMNTKGAHPNFIYESSRFPMHENLIRTHDREIQVIARLDKPVIVVMADVLSSEECEQLINLAKGKKAERSKVVDPLTGRPVLDSARTSFGTSFAPNENPLITKLDRRIAEIMNSPVENGESLQVLHYKIGNEFKPHYDYFTDTESVKQVHFKNGGQRTSTLVLYLNDVNGGGETIFPEIGLSIAPKKGYAVYFEYCNSLSQLDSMTLHGGAPVSQGEKWVATKWMRQRRLL